MKNIEIIDTENVAKKSKGKLTKELLIEKIQQWARDHSTPPKSKDFINNPEYPSLQTIKNEFGTWNKGLEAAGFGNRPTGKPNGYKKYTRKELIDKMQEWKEKNGTSPTQEDFSNNKDYPNYMNYIREFGSWNKALDKAGLYLNVMNCTREEMIEKIQQFVKENNRLPIKEDFSNNPKYPNCGTIINEFGTWNNAKIAAGFEPNDTTYRGRIGELQQLSEFKTPGVIDLSGQNRNSSYDGICPKGERFDTKSAGLIRHNGRLGWSFSVSQSQLDVVDYLILRAYEDNDFHKPYKHKWIVPIKYIEGKSGIFIYKYWKLGKYNVYNMKKFEQ